MLYMVTPKYDMLNSVKLALKQITVAFAQERFMASQINDAPT